MSKSAEFPLPSIDLGSSFVSPVAERIEMVPQSSFERYQNERNARLKVAISKTKDNPAVFPSGYYLQLKNPMAEEPLVDLAQDLKDHFPPNQARLNTADVWELVRPATMDNEEISVHIVLTGGFEPKRALKTTVFVTRKNFDTYLEADREGVRTKTRGELNSELPVNGDDLIFWLKVVEAYKKGQLEE